MPGLFTAPCPLNPPHGLSRTSQIYSYTITTFNYGYNLQTPIWEILQWVLLAAGGRMGLIRLIPSATVWYGLRISICELNNSPLSYKMPGSVTIRGTHLFGGSIERRTLSYPAPRSYFLITSYAFLIVTACQLNRFFMTFPLGSYPDVLRWRGYRGCYLHGNTATSKTQIVSKYSQLSMVVGKIFGTIVLLGPNNGLQIGYVSFFVLVEDSRNR